MPPRKTAAERRAEAEGAPVVIPTDAEILAAIVEYRQLTEAQHAAYDAYTECRVRLVDVLRRAGVVGLSSL
jgi:hypothetical protein